MENRENIRAPVAPERHEPKNLVQWGPIVAGVVTTVAVMILLTVLGLAVGASALEPREAGEGAGTFASIWGAVSGIIAFLAGGFVAGRSASVSGTPSALLNGFIVGATMMLLVLYMVGAGVGNLFGAVAGNVGDIANLAQDQAIEADVTQEEVDEAAQQAEEEAAAMADDAFETAEGAAWGTFIGILLAHVASVIGGVIGSNSRNDIRQRPAEQ